MNASPYSRWQDAMFAQQRLAREYQGETGIRYLLGFAADMNAKHYPDERRDPRTLAAIHAQTIKEAEPVWVSEEACDLVDHARHSLKPEPVLRTDPFVPCGFALLARPLIIHDAPVNGEHPGRTPGGQVPVRAIAWMMLHDEEVEQGCFWISYLVHIDDELAREGGDPRWAGYEDDMRRMLPLSLAHLFQWTWGASPWEHPDPYHLIGETAEDVMARGREQVQLAQTLWRIGSQIIPTKRRAERQMRRESARRKLTKTEDVTIIRLRRSREYGDEQDEPGYELSVQFLVRGYWATRHTREGPRQVWVRPHVKGPAGAPFKQTTRAWEFTR